MKKWLVAALFWWIFGSGAFAHAQIRGGTEVEVRQGQLSRWEVSARPEPGVEARAWWSPDRGGAGWVRWHQLQIGPLLPVASLEGRRSWGAGSRLSPGHWGLSFDGRPWGFWAVQTPSTFEAGSQLRGEWGPWVAAWGGERVWSLEAQPDSPWIDRVRAGFTWAEGEGEAASETSGVANPGSPWSWTTTGRLRWRLGGAEVSLAGRQDWTAKPQTPTWSGGGGWSGDLGSLRISGTSDQGWEAKAKGRLGLGPVVAEVRAEGALGPGNGRFRPGLGFRGRQDAGRWSVDWDAVVTRESWTHRFDLRWSQDGFEAEAVWKVEGQRLGWMGPGAEVELTLRWPFS